jgi:hypothetical protein
MVKKMNTLDKIIKKGAALIGTTLLASQIECAAAPEIKTMKLEERVMPTQTIQNTIITNNYSNGTEYKIILKGKHVASLIYQNHEIMLRGHPGDDEDGWGTTEYLKPFFSNIDFFMGYINIDIKIQGNSCYLKTSGTIPGEIQDYRYHYPISVIFGTFDRTVILNYDANNKKLTESGTLNIKYNYFVTDYEGDLNITKIASLYLTDVPLLNGTNGNTGDMGVPHVTGQNLNFDWHPDLQPGHFPNDHTKYLTIDLPAENNIVDSARQGYSAIKSAYKPGFKISIESAEDIAMIFGGIYTTAYAKQFWQDNIGITPLILMSEPKTNFNFAINTEWSAHKDDHLMDLVSLTATNSTNNWLGVYRTENLKEKFQRLGSLKLTNGKFEGVLKEDIGKTGFYQLKEE